MTSSAAGEGRERERERERVSVYIHTCLLSVFTCFLSLDITSLSVYL